MRPIHTILACIVWSLASCTVVRKDAEGTVTGAIFGTDADAMVIDGPVPVVVGQLPMMDKKGVLVGYKPIYGPGPEGGQRAMFAAYGMNNSRSFGKAANVVTTSVLGYIAGEVTKAKDAGVAANEAKNIDAASKASSEANALAAQQEANRSKETVMGMELAAPAP